jgi:hypothetical protein
MPFPFPVASFTLDPPKIKRNFLHGGILSDFTITGGMTDKTLLLGIFGVRGGWQGPIPSLWKKGCLLNCFLKNATRLIHYRVGSLLWKDLRIWTH